MGNNDINNKGICDKLLNSNLVGVIVGALLGILVIQIADYFRNNHARDDLKEIISWDVESTKSRLDLFLRAHSCEEIIKKSHAPEWTPEINDYDTSIFDAYIHKIPLLPKDSARRILLFYSNLKAINEAKYILQNNKGSDMSPEDREVWAKVICEGSDKTAKVGEKIIMDCTGKPELKLDATFIELTPDGSCQLKMVEMSAASSTVD